MGLIAPCREAAAALASGEEPSASWWRRAALRIHLAMCAHCARLRRQFAAISEGLRSAWSPSRLSEIEPLKRRILERLRSRRLSDSGLAAEGIMEGNVLECTFCDAVGEWPSAAWRRCTKCGEVCCPSCLPAKRHSADRPGCVFEPV